MGVDMKERAAHPRPLCSKFHRASELIGRRWTGAIIFVLMESPRCRFATLRKEIHDITDRMLSERLFELEQDEPAVGDLAPAGALPIGARERDGITFIRSRGHASSYPMDRLSPGRSARRHWRDGRQHRPGGPTTADGDPDAAVGVVADLQSGAVE